MGEEGVRRQTIAQIHTVRCDNAKPANASLNARRDKELDKRSKVNPEESRKLPDGQGRCIDGENC